MHGLSKNKATMSIAWNYTAIIQVAPEGQRLKTAKRRPERGMHDGLVYNML